VSFIFDGSGGGEVRKVCSGDPGEDFIQSCAPVTADDFQVCASLECDVGNEGLDFYRAGAGYR